MVLFCTSRFSQPCSILPSSKVNSIPFAVILVCYIKYDAIVYSAFQSTEICIIGRNRNWHPRMEWTVLEVCIISKGMGVKLPFGHPFLSSQNYLHRRRYFLVRPEFVFFLYWSILLEYGLNNFLIRFVGSNVQDCVEVLPRRGPRCC